MHHSGHPGYVPAFLTVDHEALLPTPVLQSCLWVACVAALSVGGLFLTTAKNTTIMLRNDASNTLYVAPALASDCAGCPAPSARQLMAYLALLCLGRQQKGLTPELPEVTLLSMMDHMPSDQAPGSRPTVSGNTSTSFESIKAVNGPQQVASQPRSSQGSLSFAPGVLGRGASSVVRLGRCGESDQTKVCGCG